MKLKERFTLLRAGYTKSEIDAMIAAEAEEQEEQEESEAEETAADAKEPEELINARNEITNLKKQLEELQKHNINNSSQKEPTKEDSNDVWNSFFGNTQKGNDKK